MGRNPIRSMSQQILAVLQAKLRGPQAHSEGVSEIVHTNLNPRFLSGLPSPGIEHPIDRFTAPGEHELGIFARL